MSQPITDFRNELKLLRERVDAQDREIAALRRRPLPQQEPPRHVRLCKTRSDSSYPTTGANTFEFAYEELSFTKSEGSQTQSFTSRSATSQGVGQSSRGDYLANGTRCLAVEQPNHHTLLVPLARDLYFRADGTGTLALNTAVPMVTLKSTWATAGYHTTLSVPTVKINFPGWYIARATLNVTTSWAQPTDHVHHYAKIRFDIFFNGVTTSSLGWVTFIFPAKSSDDPGPHNHAAAVGDDGAHTHAFDVIDTPFHQVVCNSLFQKTGTTAQNLDVRPTVFAASTGGPVIGDFAAVTTSSLEVWPGYYIV